MATKTFPAYPLATLDQTMTVPLQAIGRRHLADQRDRLTPRWRMPS